MQGSSVRVYVAVVPSRFRVLLTSRSLVRRPHPLFRKRPIKTKGDTHWERKESEKCLKVHKISVSLCPEVRRRQPRRQIPHDGRLDIADKRGKKFLLAGGKTWMRRSNLFLTSRSPASPLTLSGGKEELFVCSRLNTAKSFFFSVSLNTRYWCF